MVKDKSSKIIFKNHNYDSLKSSVFGVMAYTNFDIDLHMLFKYIPIIDYEIIKKKRGRKKKNEIPIKNKELPEGSVITCQFENNIRGKRIKKVKEKLKKSSRPYFLNSVTLVLVIRNNKFVNVKVSGKRNFQISGCTSPEQYINTMCVIYNLLKQIEEYIGHSIYQLIPLSNNSKEVEENPIVIFNKTMINKDYKVDFNIDREKLSVFLNKNTDFSADYDPSMSPGINVKITNTIPHELKLDKLELLDDMKYIHSIINYDDYYNLLSSKDKIKLQRKADRNENKHSFMIHQSGSIVQSDIGPNQKEIFKLLLSLLYDNKDEIKEIIND